jgi:drug/metabolite transporter (DMT)-like permease
VSTEVDVNDLSTVINDESDGFDHFWRSLIPIGLAMLSVAIYTASGLISRQAMNMGYKKTKFAVDLTFIGGCFFLVAFIYNQLYLPLKFTFYVTFLMSIAGLFCFSAFIFGNYAMQSGKGAIVTAIV